MSTVGFCDLPWHDATLLGVVVDRSSPGLRDEVVLSVEWPDSSRARLVFKKCYGLAIRMNFNHLGEDNILTADELSDCDELRDVRAKWSRVGVELSGVKLYRVETNSTAGVLSVMCMDFELAPP